MRHILLILFALVALLLPAHPAVSQDATQAAPKETTQVAPKEPDQAAPKETAQERIGEDLVQWDRLLKRIDKQIKGEAQTLSSLGDLKKEVNEAQRKLNGVRKPLSVETGRFKKLVDALGPPPKKGEPLEAPEIAAQREDLNVKLATAEGRLKKLDLLLERTRTLLTEIIDANRKAFGDKLLVRTPSLISIDTWSKAGEEFVRLLSRSIMSPLKWVASPQVRNAIESGYFAFILIAIIVAAGLGWLLRRWLVRRFGRDPDIENPTFRMRVLATLAEGVARTVIPILIVVVTYAALKNGGLLTGLFQYVILGFAVSVVMVSILYGLPRAMLSPSMPQWRLANMGENTARLWSRYALTLAIIVGLDLLLIIPTVELQPSPTLTTTYSFIVGSAYSVLFFLMASDKRLWLRPEEDRAGGQQIKSAGKTSSRRIWWGLARAIVVLLALAIPIAALAGYGVLSNFIARRLLATTAVFLTILVLHGLARDLIAVFTRDTEQPPAAGEPANLIYVWSVLLLDIGLVISMAFVLLPLWGGHWDSLLDRIGWSLTGFKIGTHVFSITDVLAGMVTFIILIVLLRTFQRFVDTRILQHTRMDAGVRNALKTGIGYVGLVLAALLAINMTGIDLSGLAIIAGALSVGVGFGLQGVVNNFVSGLILLAERPIKVGDWVEVGPHEGIVKHISVRSTEIKTFSRASVIVPNSELISSSVVNWLHKDRTGRVEIPVGVAYGSDVRLVHDTLLQCASEHEGILRNPEPFVLFRDFADSALLFELRCYIGNVERRIRIASDLRFAIDEAFRQAGISIPFPQRDIHIMDSGDVAKTAMLVPAKKSTSTKRGVSRKSGARSKAKPTQPRKK